MLRRREAPSRSIWRQQNLFFSSPNACDSFNRNWYETEHQQAAEILRDARLRSLLRMRRIKGAVNLTKAGVMYGCLCLGVRGGTPSGLMRSTRRSTPNGASCDDQEFTARVPDDEDPAGARDRMGRGLPPRRRPRPEGCSGGTDGGRGRSPSGRDGRARRGRPAATAATAAG